MASQINTSNVNTTNSIFRGTGAGKVSDRLSLGQRTRLIEAPVTFQPVHREVVPVVSSGKVIEKEVVVNVARSDPEDRKIIAECMAKIALLIMENNKIRYQIERTEHQISQKQRR